MGGTGQAVLVATISPSPDNYSESKETLNYARLTKTITGIVCVCVCVCVHACMHACVRCCEFTCVRNRIKLPFKCVGLLVAVEEDDLKAMEAEKNRLEQERTARLKQQQARDSAADLGKEVAGHCGVGNSCCRLPLGAPGCLGTHVSV